MVLWMSGKGARAISRTRLAVSGSAMITESAVVAEVPWPFRPARPDICLSMPTRSRSRGCHVSSPPPLQHTYSARHPTSLSLARSYEIRLDPLAS